MGVLEYELIFSKEFPFVSDYILVNAFSAFSVRTKVDFLDRSLGEALN